MIQSTLKTLACKYIKLLIMVDERFYAGVTSTNYVFPVFAVLSSACRLADEVNRKSGT